MWDFQNMVDSKRVLKDGIQTDVDKLEEAIKLVSEVNETFSEAFWSNTESGAVSVAMKLAHAISEIKLVKNALKDFQEKI